MDYDELKKLTDEKLKSPRVGDWFQEMYSFAFKVVFVDDFGVVVREYYAGGGRKLLAFDSREEFYKTYVDTAGPWVLYEEKGFPE